MQKYIAITMTPTISLKRNGMRMNKKLMMIVRTTLSVRACDYKDSENYGRVGDLNRNEVVLTQALKHNLCSFGTNSVVMLLPGTISSSYFLHSI